MYVYFDLAMKKSLLYFMIDTKKDSEVSLGFAHIPKSGRDV